MKLSKIIYFLGILVFIQCATKSTSTESKAKPGPEIKATIITLWPNGAPDAVSNGGDESIRVYDPTGDHVVTNIHKPTIIAYIPSKEKSTGIAMIIAPGGGHRELWIDHEGYAIAEKLKANGIAAFVLKYRLANEEGSIYSVDRHAVGDMQRALRLVRSKSLEWNISPDKIGVIGFSAGGEVAAITDMTSNSIFTNAKDPIDKMSSKPNFQALIYPGRSERINPNTRSSPVFIVAGYHDRDDISKGMANLYLKFKDLNISTEMHIYANVGHGFGIRETTTGAISKWPDRLVDWINETDFTKK